MIDAAELRAAAQAMKWFAIRTTPGAQMSQREYWHEPSASALKGQTRGKGYRIASSLNPERSAVELALEGAGFTYYMPVEFVAVRNRLRKGVYDLKRFALLKGYAFVTDITTDAQIAKLLKLPGVRSLVANEMGVPYPIPAWDIHRLRMFEQNSRAEATERARKLTLNETRDERKAKKNAARAARQKLFHGRQVKLLWGDKIGREATVQAWHDEEHVRVLVHALDAAPELSTVPYEYLRIAS